MAAGFQKDWSTLQSSFRRFLNWLDGGVESGGENYLELRRRLIRFFGRKNCLFPEDLADETLSRVARQFAEDGAVTDNIPERYCYVAAKFVFLEYTRQPFHKHVSLDEPCDSGALTSRLAAPNAEEDSRNTVLLDCLQRCLKTLTQDQQDLVVSYYRGEQGEKIRNRRGLANRLGLTMNALSIRACRIRDRIEQCVRNCSGGEMTAFPKSDLNKKEG